MRSRAWNPNRVTRHLSAERLARSGGPDFSAEVAYDAYVHAAGCVGCSDRSPDHPADLQEHSDDARGRFDLSPRNRIADAERPNRSSFQDEEDRSDRQGTWRPVVSHDP